MGDWYCLTRIKYVWKHKTYLAILSVRWCEVRVETVLRFTNNVPLTASLLDHLWPTSRRECKLW